MTRGTLRSRSTGVAEPNGCAERSYSMSHVTSAIGPPLVVPTIEHLQRSDGERKTDTRTSDQIGTV